ncbi:MAG: WYL domain-containing protein, partial [Pseudomonadales bacterium]
PLRLFYFRDNWFLQAWCHATNASLIFALARLHHVAVSSRAAIAGAGTEVTGLRLVGEEPTRHRARLRFVPSAAAAVAGEHWHPEQVGQFATDGSYELIVPYAQTQDVLGHVLRHGANVVVESPKSLRRAVARALLRSLSLYPDLTTATPKRRSDG